MAEKFQAVECIGPDLDGYDIDEAIAGYRLQLSCLSLDAHLSLRKFIAQPVLLILQSDAKPRHFHGHVTQCRLQGANGGMARYLLTIEPWLAFLRYRRDSRVYQDLTVPEIIDAVLRDYQGQGKLQPQWRMDLRDTRVYARRSLVTQYQESDLAFISRLLSEEGMFYYVEHAGVSNSPSLGAHTVVIADHNASFQSNARADVQFTQASAVMAQDSIDRWRSLDRWQTNSVEILTWDYRQASVHDKNGALLHQVSYFSHRYLQLYMMDITPFTDRDLGTWDFFVALKDACEKIGAKCSSKPEDLALVTRIRANTGEACPRDGYWLVADTMDKQMELQRGQSMPPHQGRNVCWEWVSRDFIPEGLYSD